MMKKNIWKPSKEFRINRIKSKIKFEGARFFQMRYLGLKIYFKRHRIIGILTILFFVLLIGNVAKDLIVKKSTASLTGDIEVTDYDEYIETLKDVPSDIQGMSQYDKISLGLEYRDNSDSDYDGLTDKEEIEVYNSDPLKNSSSEDLYSDGYKIANGMDLNTSYEYRNDRSFDNNKCNEILLKAKNSNDFIATVEDCSDRYELDNWGIEKVYKGYFLCNFSGDMTIDISQVILENALSISDIDVWIYEGTFLAYGYSDLKKCKFTEENNSITLKYEFNPDYSYYIFITPEKSLINSILKTNKTSAIQVDTKTSNTQYIITDFFNKITVYYPQMEDEHSEENFMKKIRDKYNATAISYKASSENKIQTMYKTYSTIIPFMENDFDEKYTVNKLTEWIPIIPKVIFSYQLCYFDDSTSISADANGSSNNNETKIKYNNYHTNFDPYEDVLPFQNFGSKYSSGNCAGISYLTCYLYNNNNFPDKGSYKDINWDLTEDSDNTTLTNPGLEDFKTKDFVDKKGNKGYLEDGLTLGERSFVDMIGAYWKQTNDTFNLNEYRIYNKERLPWSTAEVMMDRLDQGKIFTASLLLADGTGHEIICYDYYWITEDEMLFRVYDSNLPMKYTDLSTLNCDGACYLQCKKINNGDGTYSFSYFYWPVRDNLMYCATSDVQQAAYSSIIISDETWKIYN